MLRQARLYLPPLSLMVEPSSSFFGDELQWAYWDQ